jgi:CRP-like cAMP-binding protein
MIDIDLLISWGATYKKYRKGEFVFYEGDEALFYYQVENGLIKMSNLNDMGREYVQGNFNAGQSFGEPPLFINEHYPASAMAVEDSTVLRLTKEIFLNILDEYPTIQKKFLVLLAHKVYAKASTAKSVINHTPEERLLSFLNDYRKKQHATNEKILIPFTRQEIANFTGLRVETVIRTLSLMRAKKKVEIINRKLYI